MRDHLVTWRSSVRGPSDMHMARCGDAETWSGCGNSPQRPPDEQEPEHVRNIPVD